MQIRPSRPPSTIVDGSSLAFVRLATAGIAALTIVRWLANGWVSSLLLGGAYTLPYPWAASVPVPTEAVATAALVLAGTAIVVWARGGASGGVVFLAIMGWLGSIEATNYLNHYWLLWSLVALLTALPSGHDVPLWAVWAVRVQVGLVYAYAGVAKLHTDWLVEALPLRLWLPAQSGLPVIGGLLDAPVVAHVASIAGAGFDLGIVPLLLWPRSRRWAFGSLVVFHAATGVLLPSIGLFPLLMTTAATVFFDPGWARRLRLPRPHASACRPAVVVLLVVVQLALPLRSFVREGDPRWDGFGYRFAWNVVAMEKEGSLLFEVGEARTVVDPRTVFTDIQVRRASIEPDLIVTMAHVLGAVHGGPVHAESWVSVNGRSAVRFIDPTIDLTVIEPSEAASVVLPRPDW